MLWPTWGAEKMRVLLCSRASRHECQEQEDGATTPPLRQPSSPEGSHAQALDPSACPDPSIRARPDQNAINRGRGQEARGRDGASSPMWSAVLQVGPHRIASEAGHRSPPLPQRSGSSRTGHDELSPVARPFTTLQPAAHPRPAPILEPVGFPSRAALPTRFPGLPFPSLPREREGCQPLPGSLLAPALPW